jgi:hypothetical protein
MSDFDPKQIEELIAKHKDVLLNKIETAVASKLGSLSPQVALAFRLLSGNDTRRVITPAPSLEYAGALLAFMRQKSYEGFQVDSAITPVVLDVIEGQVVAFYSSQEVTEAIIAGIMQEVRATIGTERVIRAEVQENLDWLRKEYTALTVDSGYSLSGMLVETSIAQIQVFLGSTAGKAIIAGLGKAMATTAGKVALQRMLTVIVQKVMASAALKTTILAIIKKVGIGVLIKTAIGKALIALLAAVGIAHVPIAWILLPLIAAFLAYEYFHFPEKLANKLPSEIRYAMSMRFGELNEKIAVAAARTIFTVLEKEMTAVRTA